MDLYHFLAGMLLVFAILYWFLKAPSLANNDKLVIPEEAQPFLGHFLYFYSNFGSDNIWAEIDKTCASVGHKTVGMSIPTRRIFVVTQPEIVKHVTNNSDEQKKNNKEVYVKGTDFHDVASDLMGDGIFAVDGPRWREQRRAAMPMFAHKLLQGKMTTSFTQHAQTVIGILDKAAANGSVVDLQSLFFRYTLDSICDIAFSAKLGTLKKPHPFGQAFDRATCITAFRFIKPWWKLWKLLNIGDEKDMRDCLKVVNGTLEAIISERADVMQGVHEEDLLSLFLNKKTKDQLKGKKTDRAAMAGEVESAMEKASNDHKYLRDLVLNFVLAGRDTTAWAMTAVCWQLFQDKHSDKQQRAAEEAQEELKEDIPCFDTLSKLPYVEACFHEALRLYPSVPLEIKFATQKDVLPDGVKVARGDLVCFAIYAMARNPKIWGSDCLEYNPSRWLAPGFHPSQWEYPVFNTKPRLCLGKTMATMEAKLLLSTLFKRYAFKLAPESCVDNPAFMFGVTMSFKDGLHATVVRR